jgi:hypothetical protein
MKLFRGLDHGSRGRSRWVNMRNTRSYAHLGNEGRCGEIDFGRILTDVAPLIYEKIARIYAKIHSPVSDASLLFLARIRISL